MAKILIVRLGAMGDILHALPAATAIRAALPNATIGWLVEERWSELLTAQGRKASPNSVSPQKPVVNNIHTVDTRRWRRVGRRKDRGWICRSTGVWRAVLLWESSFASGRSCHRTKPVAGE